MVTAGVRHTPRFVKQFYLVGNDAELSLEANYCVTHICVCDWGDWDNIPADKQKIKIQPPPDETAKNQLHVITKKKGKNVKDEVLISV